jgi:hypothetical protein
VKCALARGIALAFHRATSPGCFLLCDVSFQHVSISAFAFRNAPPVKLFFPPHSALLVGSPRPNWRCLSAAAFTPPAALKTRAIVRPYARPPSTSTFHPPPRNTQHGTPTSVGSIPTHATRTTHHASCPPRFHSEWRSGPGRGGAQIHDPAGPAIPASSWRGCRTHPVAADVSRRNLKTAPTKTRSTNGKEMVKFQTSRGAAPTFRPLASIPNGGAGQGEEALKYMKPLVPRSAPIRPHPPPSASIRG